jgi:hypothetical protein
MPGPPLISLSLSFLGHTLLSLNTPQLDCENLNGWIEHSSMDSDGHGFTQHCICGRAFTQHSAYNYHRRNCKSGRKRLSQALTTAKEHWKRRKTHELSVGGDGMPSLQGHPDPPQDVAPVVRWRAF